ncbi:NAD(P)/FAD-dependent oxidoreductase [Actinocrispum wychmicini]|uniref:NADH dehydrogenase n=1 Tax=Actinocrispum wychmicini TaxID=1213861 RepID=A0A4R2IRH5_9PSEU|nr:NAD(P)/FAD-dependent oxidoreductase [Actinocrispum wychmicini]TCO47971.1 NADH dehydrogenase [Actinocrispum wychmicini]
MTKILIVGGGYVGLYTALRLRRRLRPGEAEITVVDPQPNMTYQPFLPEAAAGSVEPRHVVVPLRRLLPGCRVVTGKVTGVDHEAKTATVVPAEGVPTAMSYDVLVLAAGSVSRTLPVPGLAESGIGFGTVGEAIYLRNHVLSRLDVASSSDDPGQRRRALTFVVVGGGYAGVEVFGELEDMARYAMKVHSGLSHADMRWVLVEASGRILPEVAPAMSDYTVKRLVKRGMEVKLDTTVTSMVDGHVVLSSGEEFDADTVVWTAGVKANPLAMRSGMPIDFRGRLICTDTLRARGLQGIWSAGDCAAVPDLSGVDAICSPSAQHAVRQAKVLADNIVASLRGKPLKPYRHRHVGSVASLGLHKGVAQVYGIKLRGWPAWLMHRAYHWSRVPTAGRKLRVLLDWLTTSLTRREIVSLGEIQSPRRDWEVLVRETGHTLSRNTSIG